MVGSRLYFDNRRPDKQGRGTLRVMITRNGTVAMLSLGIRLLADQWDGAHVVNHPEAKLLNSAIRIKHGDIERSLIDLTNSGRLTGKSAAQAKALLEEELSPGVAQMRKEAARKRHVSVNGLAAFFRRFIARIDNKGTRGLYQDTYNKIVKFCQEHDIEFDNLLFEDIKQTWLEDFERFCLRTEKQNTASRHLRDIRAVFNAAIDDNLTNSYPFRKFKIKHEITEDKSYTSEELRRLFSFKSKIGGEREAIDIFKLMFCLIGINSVDLAECKPAIRGRVLYIRKKTGKHYKHYNIKIEPEAAEIIRRYRGKDHLVNILEKSSNYKTYFSRLSKNLKKAGKQPISGKKSVGEALLPDICTGSARTSWATIAQDELDIPREVIAAALGHSTVDVTTTYLRTKWRKKVDEANRKVLDLVFYGRK